MYSNVFGMWCALLGPPQVTSSLSPSPPFPMFLILSRNVCQVPSSFVKQGLCLRNARCHTGSFNPMRVHNCCSESAVRVYVAAWVEASA
jgi:hypothetical protein